MISREDMLELTRRMTPERTSFTRAAGAYMDADGFVDGTFNVFFGSLSGNDKKKQLGLAKTVPFSETNRQLQEFDISKKSSGPDSVYRLLDALKECGLKNDALLETFYELIAENYASDTDYVISVFHDRYDIPLKGKDKAWQWESEETYEYLICTVGPQSGSYEAGKPEWGFLYPSFANRSCYRGHIAVFEQDPDAPHHGLNSLLKVDKV